MSERYRVICCSDQTLISVHLCGVNDEIVQEDPQAIEEKKKGFAQFKQTAFHHQGTNKRSLSQDLGVGPGRPLHRSETVRSPRGRTKGTVQSLQPKYVSLKKKKTSVRESP